MPQTIEMSKRRITTKWNSLLGSEQVITPKHLYLLTDDIFKLHPDESDNNASNGEPNSQELTGLPFLLLNRPKGHINLFQYQKPEHGMGTFTEVIIEMYADTFLNESEIVVRDYYTKRGRDRYQIWNREVNNPNPLIMLPDTTPGKDTEYRVYFEPARLKQIAQTVWCACKTSLEPPTWRALR
jgi:hypothetical protein